MLAPSAIILRRPSGEADLILSRTQRSSVSGGGGYKDHPLDGDSGDGVCDIIRSPIASPSDSVHSAPLYGLSWSADGRGGGGTDGPSGHGGGGASTDGSLDMSRASSPCSGCGGGGDATSSTGGSPAGSPETRRRYWLRRLLKMKDDMDRVGTGLQRRACTGLRNSFDSIRHRLSPSARRKDILYGDGITLEIIKDGVSGNGGGRRCRMSRRHRTRSFTELDDDDDDVDGYDVQDHNFSTALLLTHLQDGLFSAEISLAKMPSGRVTIRIRDYKLEITASKGAVVNGSGGGGGNGNSRGQVHETVDLRPSQETHHQSHHQSPPPSKPSKKPFYCGSISIPIFVNPSSLEFHLDDNILHVEGVMKGCAAADRKKFSSSESNICRLPPVGCLDLLSPPGGVHGDDVRIGNKNISLSANDVTRDCLQITSAMQSSSISLKTQ